MEFKKIEYEKPIIWKDANGQIYPSKSQLRKAESKLRRQDKPKSNKPKARPFTHFISIPMCHDMNLR
jgi:hypothetical protein